jgi:pimeloyl-ACP methyl ester carboxylesterase
LLERPGRGGPLSALRFPAAGEPRGTVLLLHPWFEWGAAYFFRRGRIEALRRAGYDAVVPDFGGFGLSRRLAGFLDRDAGDAIAGARQLKPPLPLAVWGVSAGGYWAHLALSRAGGAAAVFFEDVAAHLFEWSWRMTPGWRAGYALFRAGFPDVYRWLDLRRHAPHLGAAAATWVSGERDRGVLPDDTRALAAMAGGAAWIVPEANHLEAIKLQPDRLIALALETFARAGV